MTRRVPVLLSVSIGLLAFSAGVWMVRADAPASQPAATGELAVVKTFPADGNGGWDYLTVDPQARRVYVARATRVMVFDADNGTLLGEVTGTPGVHGVALVPERSEGFASNGKSGTVSVFDLKTFKTIREIKAGVADGAGHVYVNVEDKSEVVAIDSKELKITARWSVAPGEEPTGLAMDAAHRRLFVGCSNHKMIILDADQGKVLADVPVGSGVDGVAFDAELNLAMSANGRDGTLTAVREGPEGKFTVVQTLQTVKSARTIAADPKTHQAYLPCTLPGEGGPGKFGLMVVGKAK